ncbi:AlpA family phage regulatory protein [Acidovorax sp. YS12]|nr:AlpA family phage regulatory protein [Acidovorax sp. YS12]
MFNNHNTAAAAFPLAATNSSNAVNTPRVPSAPAVPKPLSDFDHLPNSAHVRLPVVMALLGCSRATVWRRVKEGCWPAPLKFGGRMALWNVGDLRKLLNKDGGSQAS